MILDTPRTSIPPFSPSCSLFTPRPPSIADLPNKRDQIGHFHLNELSPHKRQGSGDRLQTPKYPPITKANGPTMQKKRGRGGSSEDVFIYGKENANRVLEEWRGFRRLSNSAFVELACRRARVTRRSRERESVEVGVLQMQAFSAEGVAKAHQTGSLVASLRAHARARQGSLIHQARLDTYSVICL